MRSKQKQFFKNKKKKQTKTNSLNGHNFAGIDFNSNEHCVILHEVSLLEHLMRDELGEPESQGIWFFAGSLEILPCWIWNEALHDIASFLRTSRLVKQCKGH